MFQESHSRGKKKLELRPYQGRGALWHPCVTPNRNIPDYTKPEIEPETLLNPCVRERHLPIFNCLTKENWIFSFLLWRKTVSRRASASCHVQCPAISKKLLVMSRNRSKWWQNLAKQRRKQSLINTDLQITQILEL